jgi:hypothetical protein
MYGTDSPRVKQLISRLIDTMGSINSIPIRADSANRATIYQHSQSPTVSNPY